MDPAGLPASHHLPPVRVSAMKTHFPRTVLHSCHITLMFARTRRTTNVVEYVFWMHTNAVFVISCIYGLDLQCAKYLVYIDLLTCVYWVHECLREGEWLGVRDTLLCCNYLLSNFLTLASLAVRYCNPSIFRTNWNEWSIQLMYSFIIYHSIDVLLHTIYTRRTRKNLQCIDYHFWTSSHQFNSRVLFFICGIFFN